MHNDILTNISDLIERLNKRAAIRRAIPTRKSVQEQKPDRISDLLEEAASKIDELAERLILAEDSLALALDREQHLIDELIVLRGERALLDAGKEYQRFKLKQ
jgi:DNA-binding transcriptional regulator YbjK